ncbi:uncharacterized protein LOC133780194 [Humulus lupulus]|uniref:uncharacterized protein LOC133780194 n=1 Tax=Humulus lupulus TaxID=3486 RepID=UPI002B4097C6|nr:uncharacterized protein LOC133780194 [Humulus lupulus]
MNNYIGTRRNDWVWQNKRGSCYGSLHLAEHSLTSWKKAQDRDIAPLPHFLLPEDGREKWSKPPLGSLKINADAANFIEASKYSFAGIIRDHDGVLLEAFSVCRSGYVAPELGEALGVREALSWLKGRNWMQAVIETDSVLVVQALRSNITMDSYFGCVIEDCKVLWKDLSYVSILFVKRSANGAAHALAKESSFVAERSLIKETISSFVLNVILQDCC